MAQPRPSCLLILDIDEALNTEETRLEVGRCYTYVGSAVIRTHEAQAEPHCRMRLLAKLGNRKYLHSADEGADELWGSVMEQWLHNQFHTVSNNMYIYNRRQREIGGVELAFEALDVELENGALRVSLALDSNCCIPADDASIVTSVRTAFNAGQLGEDVVAVSAPAPESLAQQKAGAEVAKAQREAAAAAQAAAQAEAQAAAAAAAEAEAADEFLESPEAADADARAAAEEQQALEAELEEKFGMDEADFVVDYRMWDVEYADGSHATFDSATGTLTR